MAEDRFELYTRLMGGEHNLPPKLPTSPTSLQSTTDNSDPRLSDLASEESDREIVDAFGNLYTYDVATASACPTQTRANEHVNKPKQSTPSHRGCEDTTATFDLTLDPRMGEESELGKSFCPFLAVTKFPYKYIDSAFLQPIATAFFDASKIYNRLWDFYYVWSEDTGKVLAFVPLTQVQALIDEINTTFSELKWRFQPHHEEEGLLLTFDDHNPDYRPRFLGSSDSRVKYDFLLTSVDHPETSNMSSGEDLSLAAFKEKIALAAEANKNKSKKLRTQKHEKQVLARLGMSKQLLQAQKYLGLVPGEVLVNMDDLNTMKASITEPASNPREADVIIIALDVEAYEKAQGLITEVGISTLDTRDLQGTAPGKNGKNWQQFVRGRHFRVTEHKSFVNGDFVAGCPDNFDFGKSEWVSIKDLPSSLTSCFHEPFSKPTSETNTQAPAGKNPSQKRNIVLLGHDIQQDINFCHKIGFSVLSRGNLVGQLDTRSMYQAYTRDTSPRGLGGIMSDFDFAAWHLHNAGNDAVYTVWAMLAICVQDAVERGTEEAKKKHDERAKEKLDSAIEAAKARAQEDAEGWDVAEDGGVVLPVPPSASGHYTMGGMPLDL